MLRNSCTAACFVVGLLASSVVGCAAAPKPQPVTQEGLAAGDLTAASPAYESRANDPAYNPTLETEMNLPEKSESAEVTGGPKQSMRADDSAKKNKIKQAPPPEVGSPLTPQP